MRHKQNLLGKVFGKLTVVGEAPKHENDFAPYWWCQCECGKKTSVRAYHLTKGITKTCGGVHHRTGDLHYKWNGCGEIPGRYICDLRKGAKARNLEFSITKEELWDLFTKQSRCCALTGVPLEFHGYGNPLTTASVDRIDSEKGYLKNNVQWVHREINRFKHAYPEDTFIRLCEAVATYRKDGIAAATSIFSKN